MIIKKGEREYTVTELGVSVQYRIKKEAAPDAEAVKLYIMCKEVF